MLKDIAIIVLLIYSAYMTGQFVYDAGKDDGIDIGYAAGVKRGFQEGRREACMIKPI